MRIIAGKYKGHKLTSFEASHLRPTTDRVKGSIFNKLMYEIPGSRVLDIFSGTGNLAIESLSREAEEVTSIESHRKSLAIMKENKAKLKIGDEWKILPLDAFKFLKSYEGAAFDVILVDPPFTEAIAHVAMQAISQSKVWRPGTVAVIESSAQERIDDAYSPFQFLDRRDFGDKNVSFFQVPN